MMNLPAAIVAGSLIVAVSLFFGLYYGLIAISDALCTLCKVLCSLRITAKHYTIESEQEGGAK